MAAGDFQLPVLSGSTNGDPIAIAATATPGTTIHTAQSGTSGVDVVELWAVNIDTAARTLTLEWGGTAAAQRIGPITLGASRGPILIAGPWPLNNGNVIAGFADVANMVNVVGRVGRYTDSA